MTVTGTGVTYYGRACVSGVVAYLQQEGFLARVIGKLLQCGLGVNCQTGPGSAPSAASEPLSTAPSHTSQMEQAGHRRPVSRVWRAGGHGTRGL